MNETSSPSLKVPKRKSKIGTLIYYERDGLTLKDLPKPPTGFIMEPSKNKATGESYVRLSTRCWPEDRSEIHKLLLGWIRTNNLQFGNY